MPAYEATYIVDLTVNDADVAAIADKYKSQVSTGGEFVDLNNWGRRRLAYEVKGKREGTYVTMRFKSEPAVAAELDRTMKIDDSILRALIVRVK